jgi:nucleotide-binding universal stress UspA family protein
MTAHRNILVAVGPLAERSAALEYAASLALRDGARLTVVSAVGSPSVFVWFVPGLPENPLHALQHACEQRLRSLARSMPPGLPITTRMRHGNAVPALLDELRHGCYDLVVIGSDQHARWRWRSRLSRTLLRRSQTSLLVVAPARPAQADGAGLLAPRIYDVIAEGA